MLSNGAYVAFACFYAAVLYLHVRRSWRTYRGFPGVHSFRFYVLDLVAAVAGMAPTAWLASQAVEGSRLDPVDAWLLAGVAGVSQVVGMFVGRIHGTVPPQDPPSEWIDALWVLGGAFYGLLLLAVSFVPFVILYTVCSYFLGTSPVVLLLILGFLGLVAYAVYLHI
ncbi:MAG: hypothetical protein NTW87_26490 [Planctomycetota bacterium]|nr:hypothetical protein [Planctomycetota bacterium]